VGNPQRPASGAIDSGRTTCSSGQRGATFLPDSYNDPGGGISVVIPTLNSAGFLRQLLHSLLDCGLAPSRIQVVDGGSADATCAIARDSGVTVVQLSSAPRASDARGPAGCMAARNHGWANCQTRYVFFLDSDMEVLPELWDEVEALTKQGVDAISIPELSVGPGPLARVRRWDRTGRFPMGLNESPRVFRVSTLHQLGGFRTDMPGFDDIELRARFVESGVEIARTTGRLIHHEEEVGLGPYLRKRLRYAGGFVRLRRLHPEYAEQLSSPANQFRALIANFRADPRVDFLLADLILRTVEGMAALASRFVRNDATTRASTQQPGAGSEKG
jgi:glycosyltransferase involved in cell wall biosynthesis